MIVTEQSHVLKLSHVLYFDLKVISELCALSLSPVYLAYCCFCLATALVLSFWPVLARISASVTVHPLNLSCLG